MTTTSKTLYFYKGSTFPVCMGGDKFPQMITKSSIEMIALGVKTGVSKEEQITDYFGQLNVIEKMLYDIQIERGVGETDAEVSSQLAEVCKRLGQTQDKLMMMWCLNINALLLMKALKNDDMNGLMRSVVIAPRV